MDHLSMIFLLKLLKPRLIGDFPLPKIRILQELPESTSPEAPDVWQLQTDGRNLAPGVVETL